MVERVEEIDIAKGICILLMVVGHSGLTGTGHDMIYAFHMPFFFFISGVTTNVERSFRVFSISKIKGLLLPFCIYYTIHIPCYAFVYQNNIIDYFLSEILNKIDGALWFIPILFFSQMINWLIPRHDFIEIVAVLVLASISSFLCLEGIQLPWNFSTLGFSTSFVLLGRIMSLGGAKNVIGSGLSTVRLMIFSSVTLLLLLIISSHYQLAMYFDNIEPILPIMVGALSGIGCVLLISSLVRRKCLRLSHFLAYTGVNTFVFIGLSQFIIKLENLYLKDYFVLKYVILFLALYGIIYVKNLFPIAKKLRL